MHKSKRSQATEIYKKRKAAIKKGDLVKVTRYGKFAEVMFAKYTSPKGKVNIRREHGSLINSRTHETINVDHATSRSDLLSSLKRSLKKLSQLIACNFKGGKDEKFITLTYSVPYQLDPRGAKKDWQRLYQNFRNNFPNAKYIAIFEPQGTLYPKDQKMVPNWHIHILVKGIEEDLSPKLKKWWRSRGLFKIKPISEIKTNNLGIYFTSYSKNLNSAFINNAARKVIQEKDTSILVDDDKDVAKGARLLFYPPHFRIYVASQNLKQPQVSYVRFDELDTSKLGKLVSESTIDVKDIQTGKIVNTYSYLNYRNE